MTRMRILCLSLALATTCVTVPAAAERPDVFDRPRLELSRSQPSALEPTRVRDDPAADPGVAPPGYHYEERPRTSLQWTGGIMFLSAWATDALIGASIASCTDSLEERRSGNLHCEGSDTIGNLYLIPIAGPGMVGLWAVSSDDDQALGWVSLATSAAQLVGASLWIYATAAGPERIVVRDRSGASTPPAVIVPVAFGSRGVGLSMSAAF